MKKSVLFLFLVLVSTPLFSQVKVISDGSLAPTGPFPITTQKYVKGGFHVLTDTFLLPSYLKDSAVVYQKKDSLFYLWGGSSWTPLIDNASGKSTLQEVLNEGNTTTFAPVFNNGIFLGATYSISEEGVGVFRVKKAGVTVFEMDESGNYMFTENAKDALGTELLANQILVSDGSKMKSVDYGLNSAVLAQGTSYQTIKIVDTTEYNGEKTLFVVLGDTTIAEGESPATTNVTIRGFTTQLSLVADSLGNRGGKITAGTLGMDLHTFSGTMGFRPNGTRILQLSSTQGARFEDEVTIQNELYLNFGKDPTHVSSIKGTTRFLSTSQDHYDGSFKGQVKRDSVYRNVFSIDSTQAFRFYGNQKDSADVALSEGEVLVSSGSAMYTRNLDKVQDGTTGERPSSPLTGRLFFDTSLSKLVVYNGTNWVNVDGSSL